MHAYIKGLEKEFVKQADAANAVAMKKYMRDQFEFFGLKSDLRRKVCNAYINTCPIPEGTALRNIIKELWKLPQREYQYFAMELFFKCQKQWNLNDISLIEYLVVNKSWWDTVDFIAGNVAGPWFKMFPGQVKKITGSWNKSDNIWLQRTSILFQLKYKKDTDLDLLYRYLIHLSGSNEFF